MNLLLKPFVILYRLYFALVFFGVLLILYPVFWILLTDKNQYKTVSRLKVYTAKMILFLQGVWHKKISVTSQLADGPYVICVNHASYLDILTMYSAFNRHRFLLVSGRGLKPCTFSAVL